ncbi:MAG: hemolysin III family protein [Candidatus Nomurabacteria bacterium]|jgi:hemolysin III|nr:hemolysin III family protein [Candidatus Nomurabacteria bacterium]
MARLSKNLPTPRTTLRGWFHVGFAPLALLTTLTLLCLAPTALQRFTVAVYLLCSIALFTFSGIYNVINWNAKVKTVLRRIDHANIFLLIAGTYTPLAPVLLPWTAENWFFTASTLLILIWGLSIIALTINVVWIHAPRALMTAIYCVVGLTAVVFIPSFFTYSGLRAIVPVVMIATGGLLYILGSVFYATKWPGRHAKVFGFHELFHIFTLAAWVCQCIGIYFAVLG